MKHQTLQETLQQSEAERQQRLRWPASMEARLVEARKELGARHILLGGSADKWPKVKGHR